MRRIIAAIITLAMGLSSFVATQAAAYTGLEICVAAHVQTVGWRPAVCRGQTAGTTGQSLRMEALSLWGAPLEVRAHVQDIGWMPWVHQDDIAGTTGRSLRMEAVQIRLASAADPALTVRYRAHVQNIGWQPWVADGATAGTTGRSLRAEAIEVQLIYRVSGTPASPTATIGATP